MVYAGISYPEGETVQCWRTRVRFRLDLDSDSNAWARTYRTRSQWTSKPSPARVHLLEIIFISGYNICEYYYHINNDLHNYFIFIYYLYILIIFIKKQQKKLKHTTQDQLGP